MGRGADPSLRGLFRPLDLLWVGITLAVLIGLSAVVTIRGRRLTGWVAAVFAWRRRHRQVPDPPSEPAVGATVMPGDHVALRWQGDYLVSAIELVPRPFTPTVIVNGEAFTDDVVNTQFVENLLTAYCPDLEADVVSAGYRVGKTAPAASSRSTSRSSAPIRRRRTDGHGSCCAPSRSGRASRRCVATPESRGWRGTWWPPPRGSQITWPATALTPDPRAASTTTTGPPRSASNARPGR